jgi:hypothetical protein
MSKLHFNGGISLQEAWVHRKITNFEYLMHLNFISGRSFNDLGQYPIFPWIIKDYSSRKLDLRDPNTFRDLSWPMGAQSVKQRQLLIDKYEDIKAAYEMSLESILDTNDSNNNNDLLMPPFHHGSHYSTMGFVLWYLIRLEPFTSLHIWLQDGKFDKTDRSFLCFFVSSFPIAHRYDLNMCICICVCIYVHMS